MSINLTQAVTGKKVQGVAPESYMHRLKLLW